MVQQRSHRWTFSSGLFIQKAPGTVLANHKLWNQHKASDEFTYRSPHYQQARFIWLLTWSVLSNQRLPLLEKVPPPCNTWAALRLAYLSVKVGSDVSCGGSTMRWLLHLIFNSKIHLMLQIKCNFKRLKFDDKNFLVVRHRCLYFGVFFRNSNWNSDLNPPSNFCISVLIIKYVAVATSIPHQHSQNWQKCCFNTYVQYNDIRECGFHNISKHRNTSDRVWREVCVCVCVYCTYFSSDILITGESRHKEKSPVSISFTDSLFSLSVTQKQEKTHIYINRPV